MMNRTSPIARSSARRPTALTRRGAAVLLCTLAAAVASLASMAILRASVHQHRRSESLRSVATAKWTSKGLDARADAILKALDAAGATDPNDMAAKFVDIFRDQYRDVQAKIVKDAKGELFLQVFLERTSRIPEMIRPLPDGKKTAGPRR